MEKTAQQKQHNNNNNTKNNPSPQQHRHNNNNKNKHYKKDSSVPKWDIEVTKRAIVLPETKSDLMNILEEVDPEELLMESLVAKSRALKNQALKTNTEEEKIESEEGEFIIEGSKVRIDLSQTCPICDKPIREIMYALHDYDHDRLAHFDCVYKKVLTSVKEKLTNNRYLAYLGSGSFGIMDPGQANQKSKMLLIEKIHPGAPLEELLHGDENNIDEEL